LKGVVFTEFLDMVETVFSPDMVDDIIDDANTPSVGSYTAVGTYSHQEIISLVAALSKRSGLPVSQLLRTFGEYLFHRFVQNYPAFFNDINDAFVLLSGIENIIHAEVLKLYPDAELPRFDIEHYDDQRLIMAYRSSRHFEDLAHGLIEGCIKHFGTPIQVTRETLGSDNDCYERFTLIR
jgi:hypothetical protein